MPLPHDLRQLPKQYCIDKTKVLLGLGGPDWREQVVDKLKSAMQEWMNSIPSFCKQSPLCVHTFLICRQYNGIPTCLPNTQCSLPACTRATTF